MTADGLERSEESVLMLYANTDYSRVDDLVVTVRPQVASVCTPGRRLILEGDLEQTYLVDRPEASSNSGWPHIAMRRARPIVDAEYVARFFER